MSDASVRTIKKYANRRLYDTAISQYVTLEDIRNLVIHSEPFQVVDAKSGEELTRSILLQIICEREDSGDPILSTEFLERVIRFYGDAMQGFMGNYLEKSIDSFLQQQETIRTQMNSLMEQTPLSVMAQMTERNMDLWKSMQENLITTYAGHTKDTDKSGKN